MNERITVDEVIAQMRDICSGASENLRSLDDAFRKYMENDEEYRKEWADYLGIKGMNILQMSRVGDAYYIIFYYIMTFLLHATKKKEIYKALLQYCIVDESITKEIKFFLYYQLIKYNFLNADILDMEIEDLMDDLYGQIYLEYREEITDEMSYIPKEQRNEDFVMVFASQILEIEHAPTRILLDCCYTLEKYLNKQVYIVNTAEFMSTYQRIPVFEGMMGSYIDAYSQQDNLIWKDRSFAFMQCPKEMPDVSVIREILNVVKSEKPYFILNIGGSSIVSDLCSNIVPTLTYGTTSGKANTMGQFQTMTKITDDDRKWLVKHQKGEDSFIERSSATPVFKEQTHSYKRADLGLPENRFIAVLVGGRLDAEIDDECMNMLERLVNEGIFIVIVGGFNRYKEYAEKNEIFRQNSRFLGFQSDTLAINEICDLYINPKRIGGGTSALEALYKGLPVVTHDFGDVGANVGSDFHVADYEAMYKQVLRYAKDKDFYGAMSKKGKAKVEELTDSKTEFIRIVQTMEQSKQFL